MESLRFPESGIEIGDGEHWKELEGVETFWCRDHGLEFELRVGFGFGRGFFERSGWLGSWNFELWVVKWPLRWIKYVLVCDTAASGRSVSLF